MQYRPTRDSSIPANRRSGSANVYGRTWTPFSWNGWGRLLGIGVSFQTNPFKACASVNVWGVDFGGCVG